MRDQYRRIETSRGEHSWPINWREQFISVNHYHRAGHEWHLLMAGDDMCYWRRLLQRRWRGIALEAVPLLSLTEA